MHHIHPFPCSRRHLTTSVSDIPDNDAKALIRDEKISPEKKLAIPAAPRIRRYSLLHYPVLRLA